LVGCHERNVRTAAPLHTSSGVILRRLSPSAAARLGAGSQSCYAAAAGPCERASPSSAAKRSTAAQSVNS
jgi:hypothetical protein